MKRIKKLEGLPSVNKCPVCFNGVVLFNECNFVTCPWPECGGSTYFCYLCSSILTVIIIQPDQHYSHFSEAEGPYGNLCNGLMKNSR